LEIEYSTTIWAITGDHRKKKGAFLLYNEDSVWLSDHTKLLAQRTLEASYQTNGAGNVTVKRLREGIETSGKKKGDQYRRR